MAIPHVLAPSPAAVAAPPRPSVEHFWHGFAPSRDTSTLLDGFAGERLRLATFRHAPHVLTGDGVGRMHRRAVLLTRHLDGDARIEQQGRRSEIAAGDFCLIDLSRPFRLETGQATVQTIYLPIATLREAVPRIDQVVAIGLHGHLAAVAYLRVMFQEIFAHASELTDAVADRLADAIPHMLAAALESMDVAEASPSQLRQQYKQQVRRFAREHLADPELCVEMIGRGVGLSASYLFELFADEEHTLMRWVRGERLARCRRELADPALRHRSIAQVAQSWGFGDMAHFSRCFRMRFGMAPRSFRQESLARPAVVPCLSDVHPSK